MLITKDEKDLTIEFGKSLVLKRRRDEDEEEHLKRVILKRNVPQPCVEEGRGEDVEVVMNSGSQKR